jgi:hypothetical protein
MDEDGSALTFGHHTTADTLNWKAGVGKWTFPITDGVWLPVSLSYDKSTTNFPIVRVNFGDVTETQTNAPSPNPDVVAGYCVGNEKGQSRGWNGKIAHVQVFNRLLSAAEKDACLRTPGSITNGLRLWLPMTNETDTDDRSGNGFDVTKTHVTTATDTPIYDSLFQFGVTNATNETIGQIAIPSNGSEPPVGVRGLGTRSKLTAHNSLTNAARFITTKGWGTTSTVIEPTVRDLYLFGNHGVADIPFTNSGELALGDNPVCHAIAIDGDAAEVTGCKVFDFRGDGISVSKSTPGGSPKVRIPRVRDNKISHCWTGIRVLAVDAHVEGNRVANCRDYGLLDLVGAVQSSGNHFFGMQTAIQFEGGASRSVNDRFSDAFYGFKITGSASGSHIADGTTEHCELKNILADAARIGIHNTRILVANTSTQHPGENNLGIISIVGLYITGNAFLTLVSGCDMQVGAYTFGQGTLNPDTGLTVRPAFWSTRTMWSSTI